MAYIIALDNPMWTSIKPFLGSSGAEERYGTCVRHENIAEKRHARQRAGGARPGRARYS